MQDQSKSDLWQLWAIQESLLQNYRSVFITSESIFVAVAAALLTTDSENRWLLMVGLVVIGLFLNRLWIELTESRGLQVSYVQTLIYRAENGQIIDKPFQQFKRFQTERAFMESEIGSPDWRMPMTKRITLNQLLPLVFYAFWFVTALTNTLQSIQSGKWQGTLNIFQNVIGIILSLVCVLLFLITFFRWLKKRFDLYLFSKRQVLNSSN